MHCHQWIRGRAGIDGLVVVAGRVDDDFGVGELGIEVHCAPEPNGRLKTLVDANGV